MTDTTLEGTANTLRDAAFPLLIAFSDGATWSCGLSKREYAAIKAMAAISHYSTYIGPDADARIAKAAVAMADALLSELAKPKGEGA